MTMPELPAFHASTPLTLGVELELQLLSPRDFDLVRGATDLIDTLHHDGAHGEIKLEITESMIEIATRPQASANGIAADLRGLCRHLLEHCRRHNIGLCGGGTHPFHRWPERRICPGERYDAFYDRYGYLAKQFTVFGQHIHVGCTSGDEAIWLTQALGEYMPLFIALSASSPFVDGVDTFFQSARLNAVSAFPLSGQCPELPDWTAFEAHFAFLRDCGLAASIKDLYWDVRPKPEFGTVEIRVCDTPLTLQRAVALAALAQALAAWLLEHRPPLQTARQAHVARYNKFLACRYGLEAKLADPVAGGQYGLRETLDRLLGELPGKAQRLGSERWLADLRAEVAGQPGDAAELRARLAQHGNLNDVVRETAERFAVSADES